MQVSMNMYMRDEQEHIEIDIERKRGEGSLPYSRKLCENQYRVYFRVTSYKLLNMYL